MLVCFLMNTPNAGRTLKTENWLCINSLVIPRHIMTCFSIIFILVIVVIIIIVIIIIIRVSKIQRRDGNENVA